MEQQLVEGLRPTELGKVKSRHGNLTVEFVRNKENLTSFHGIRESVVLFRLQQTDTR